MIELVIFSLLGICIGIATGLVPGLHVNTLIPLLLSAPFLTSDPFALAVLIVSTSVSQIFVSFIPSIFLGAPEADTALSVLPGHRILFEGRGYEAIRITAISGIISLIVSIATILLLSNHFTTLYEISRPYVPYLIGATMLMMIVSEKGMRKIISAFFIILVSGIFGMVALNSPLVNQENILFPALSGLFGVSSLITSLGQKSKIPEQEMDSQIKISKMNFAKSIILGSLAGIAVGFLPALGVSQAAAMAQYMGGMSEARSFLVSLSSINMANEVFSLNSLYLVNNPRSGASVAIEKLMGEISFENVLSFVGVMVFVSGLSVIATLYLGKRVPQILAKMNYKLVSLSIIIFISLMVFFVTNFEGILVLTVSTAIGLASNYLEIRRSTCMGILLVPSFLFFTGLNPLAISALGM